MSTQAIQEGIGIQNIQKPSTIYLLTTTQYQRQQEIRVRQPDKNEEFFFFF